MENKEIPLTAVEWLELQLLDLVQFSTAEIRKEYKSKFEQARQMEKEQIQECWDTAHQVGRFEGKGIAEENWQTFQQYYNETYGK